MYDFQIRDDKRRTKGRLAQIEWARDTLRTMYDYTNTRRDKASDKGITLADDRFDEEYDALDQTQRAFEETLKAETTMQSLRSLIWNKDVDVEQHVKKLEEFWDRTQVSWADLDRRLRQSALSAASQSAASLPIGEGATSLAAQRSGTQPLSVMSPQPTEQRSQSAPLPSQPIPSDAASVLPTEGPTDRLQSPVPKSSASTNGTYSYYDSHSRGNTFQVGGSNNNGTATQVQHHGGTTTYKTLPSPMNERSPSQSGAQVEESNIPGTNDNGRARNTGWGYAVSGDGVVTDGVGVSNVHGNGHVVGGDWSWLAKMNSSGNGNSFQVGGSGNVGSTWQETYHNY
ncbi:hypothetical protein CONPUDRAFT_71989 [Coniophora puteana RWD-64-598 SS2]|uniref:Uncharacterized protein n=1 Tax=Coniophora puteana (strain RWD-64-598) TaxID=741705 RepID=A0A5M3MWB7_CONPW|nr:uncharacterized protein CONPUDRAFT_71989 [Coniophora puteana RWD-64-598 SS2]EIW83443.1 hypothetical protein CONPUDRAFT_71989 [Coniophora puteana RWD-64-598 SS2]